MSSFLCFVCHSTVNEDTNEDTRDKYREVIGMNLCPDSHLCHICCHFLNKMCLFKSICLKRSLEYPVLFSERGTINLQRSDTQVAILCSEDLCLQHLNSRYYFYNSNENSHSDDGSYCQLQDEANYDMQKSDLHNEDFMFTKDNDGVFNDDFIPALEPVVMTENEQTLQDNENLDKMVLLELSSKIDVGIEMPDIDKDEPKNSDINEDQSKAEIVEDNSNTTENDLNVETQMNIPKNRGKKGKSGFIKSILTVKEQKNELEAARREEKYLTASYKCYNCAISFHFKESYQAHMMRHEESNGEHSCSVCSLRFASAAVWRAHAANHAERYACARCGLTVRRSQTTAHTLKCDVEGSDVTCALCSRSFRGRSHLQQHMKRFHQSKNSSRSYLCNVCGNRYNNQAAVHTHMITHINRKFSCDQCSSTFSSPYTLNQHRKRHSVPQEPRVHYCQTCRVGYTSRKSLLAHMRNAMAHNQSLHMCGWCGRACASAASLRAHAAARHDRTRHLRCDTCARHYSTRKALVRHLRSHTEVTKTTPLCHACGETFKALVRHLRSHTDVTKTTPMCPACGETFKSTSILKRHLQNVCEKDKHEQLTY